MIAPKLSIDRYKEIGTELYRMREILSSLFLEINSKHRLASRRVTSVINWIDKLRSALDDDLFNDYPMLGLRELTSVFYKGGTR